MDVAEPGAGLGGGEAGVGGVEHGLVDLALDLGEVPLAGRVRVMSAVYSESASTPASSSSSSPALILPLFRVQCSTVALFPDAAMVS